MEHLERQSEVEFQITPNDEEQTLSRRMELIYRELELISEAETLKSMLTAKLEEIAKLERELTDQTEEALINSGNEKSSKLRAFKEFLNGYAYDLARNVESSVVGSIGAGADKLLYNPDVFLNNLAFAVGASALSSLAGRVVEWMRVRSLSAKE